MEQRNNLKAWLYLAPLLIIMSVFIFYPLVNGFYMSILENYEPLLGRADGYTLVNFVRIFRDQDFLTALKNTFVITFVSVPISIVLALVISVALKSIPKLRGFFQTVFFLPYVTNAIAIGMAFAFMFHADYGLINAFLGIFGIDPIDWIGSQSSWIAQMSALLVYTIWHGLAFKILVFTSGLENIDKQYYDAARVDSANRVTIFKRITVPLLSPLILYLSVTSMIGALKAYRQVVGMFGERLGGQQGSMMTIVAYVYEFRNQYADVGAISKAAAAAIILFFITVIFSLVQGVVSRKRVHY
jgi:multiple sugar transport system permease protein